MKKFSGYPSWIVQKTGFKGSIFHKSAKKLCKKRHIFPKFLQKKDTAPGHPPPSIRSLIHIYACYKIFSFNFNGVSHSKTSIDKEEPIAPDEEILSPKEPEIFLRDQGSPHNINKEPNVAIKKEPIISKNLKQSSKI